MQIKEPGENTVKQVLTVDQITHLPRTESTKVDPSGLISPGHLASAEIPPVTDVLKVSNLPNMSKIWGDQVRFHLQLYDLRSKLQQVAIERKSLEELEPEQFDELYKTVNFAHGDEELLKYQIGLINLFSNQGYCLPESLDRRQDYFTSNLLNLIAMQLSNNLNLFQSCHSYNLQHPAGKISHGVEVYEIKRLLIASDPDLSQKEKMTSGGLIRGARDIPQNRDLEERINDFNTKLNYLISLYRTSRDSISPTDVLHKLHSNFGHDRTKPFTILIHREIKLSESLPPEFLKEPQSYLATALKAELNNEDPSSWGGIFHPNGYFDPTSHAIPNESKDKVSIIQLSTGQRLFCKRINPLRVRYPEEEIEVAEGAKEKFASVNQSQDKVKFNAQDFVGIVYDGQGVFYLLSKEIIHEGNLLEYDNQELSNLTESTLRQVPKIPDPGGPARLRDCLYTQPTNDLLNITIIDFETLPSIEELKSIYT